MAKPKKRVKGQKKTIESPFKFYWTKNNYLLLITGLVLLTVGFVLMAQGPWDNPVSLTIAPLVILVAYLVIFPLAIFYKNKSKETD
jgi:ATP/ADP translocase